MSSMQMRKKLLVTGSSGHSGFHISRLLSTEFEIVGVDLVAGEYTKYIGSLVDKGFVAEITEGVLAIVHTASLHAPHITTHSRQEFIDTNVVGTLNLLEACLKKRIQKFVYTSTTSLYGESLEDDSQAVWVTEELPTIPRDIYDITKIAAEGLSRVFFNAKALQTVVLRVSRFWNEPLENKIFYRMYRGVDVRDVADAHQLALYKSFDEFQIFNISSQSIFAKGDVRDLKNNCRTLLELKIPELLNYYQSQNWTLPSSIDRVYVIDRAKDFLGYTPKYNVLELLREHQR